MIGWVADIEVNISISFEVRQHSTESLHRVLEICMDCMVKTCEKLLPELDKDTLYFVPDTMLSMRHPSICGLINWV